MRNLDHQKYARAEAPVLFQGTVCGFGATHEVSEVVAEPAVAEGSALARQKRRYRRSTPEHGPRTYRTRPDPFAAVLTVISQRLEANPERTAKAIFRDLQAEYPGRYPEVQLRTLQRRIAAWRAQALLTFQDQWLAEDHLQAASLLRGNVDWRSEDEAPE